MMKIFKELWVFNEPIKDHNHAMIHKRTCLQLIIKNQALESLLIVFLSPSPSSRLLSCEMAHQLLRYRPTHGNGKFLRKKEIDLGVQRNNPFWWLLGKRGCRGRGGCLHGGLVTRSSRVDEVTLFLLCSSAHGLSACHYGWFSQFARTWNSALEREKLTALENGGKRREMHEEEE